VGKKENIDFGLRAVILSIGQIGVFSKASYGIFMVAFFTFDKDLCTLNLFIIEPKGGQQILLSVTKREKRKQ
jgi:hypothetical protein